MDHRRASRARAAKGSSPPEEARGFEIIDRNFRTRHGELDLVARDERRVVFCEVKTRIVSARAGPLSAAPLRAARFDRRAQAPPREGHGVLRADAHDRLGSGSPAEIRFDAVGITLDGSG